MILLKAADKFANKVHTESKDVVPPPDDIQKFHKSMNYVVDMNADTLQLIEGKDLKKMTMDRLFKKDEDSGHVDMPRLTAGILTWRFMMMLTTHTEVITGGFFREILWSMRLQ